MQHKLDIRFHLFMYSAKLGSGSNKARFPFFCTYKHFPDLTNVMFVFVKFSVCFFFGFISGISPEWIALSSKEFPDKFSNNFLDCDSIPIISNLRVELIQNFFFVVNFILPPTFAFWCHFVFFALDVLLHILEDSFNMPSQDSFIIRRQNFSHKSSQYSIDLTSLIRNLFNKNSSKGVWDRWNIVLYQLFQAGFVFWTRTFRIRQNCRGKCRRLIVGSFGHRKF